ncbi:hypothetical protein ALI22I_04870 [Saccharothrix sp. ALI-22-I]|uniref:hypothetical protein n=1 Tax=Saccharothrix sp. ALI-22-I TaxID=1933778 RepID=UPI00097C5020|nr:hypothetical protein [Saccharothrix sp. ALI-22-I]ONI92277.1 hypothetical protein ALI22I_04870 [Saccharothrix sp. ALI-22-I]
MRDQVPKVRPRLQADAGGRRAVSGRAPRILQLQRTAGNVATTTLLSVQRQDHSGGELSAEQQRQLLHASTTLRQVQPLSAGDSQTLQQAVPAAPLLESIRERDAKRGQLADRTAELERMRDQQAHPPEHGAPPNREMVDEVARAVDGLTADVTRLEQFVQAGIGALGISSEHELASLITDRFPRMFLERGKQIALTELEHNRRIVEAETHRYGLDACIDPSARQALVTAAQDLLAHDQRIDELQQRLGLARSDVDMPSGGPPDPARMSSSYHDMTALQQQVEQAGAEREERRRRYALQHPILLRGNIDLRAIASGDTARFDTVVGGELRQISENIDATRDNIDSGRLKVWNLTDIARMTSQDLGVANNELLQTAIREYVGREQADDTIVRAAVAALAITAAIVATMATGGVAVVAGAVALGVGGYQATQSVRDFLAEGAAGNVALDPAVQDISRQEPELGWLILDLISVGLDAIQVVRAVQALRTVVRTVSTTGQVVEFAAQARRVLPAAAAERVVASVTRQAGTRAAIGRTVEAIGAQFRRADLAEVVRHLEEVADRGYQVMAGNLRAQGRIRPLTREGLEAVYHGDELATKIANYLGNDGIYDPIRGWLWVKPGHFNEVSSTIVHETTHWLQTTQHAGLTIFMEEFQAYTMEQRYVRALFRSVNGDLDQLPSSLVWLIGASEERIAAHILENYPAARRVTDLDAARTAEEVLARMRVFQ